MIDVENITKVTIFYAPDGDVYAFSENRTLATLFEGTRVLRGYIKKKVTMNELQYRAFLSFYQNRMMFLNVLTDGDKSFDFVTTYQENADLDNECDKIYNHVLELESTLIPLPFTDKIRDNLGEIIMSRKSEVEHFGKYNTFEIFVKLFKESIL